MSATLRYEIPTSLAGQILLIWPELYHAMKVGELSIWQGVGRPRRECSAFSIKLPDGSWLAYSLAFLKAKSNAFSSKDVRALKTLQGKLRTSLGLPAWFIGLPELFPFSDGGNAERLFLEAIDKEPGSEVNWSAYADWLQEQEEADSRVRGQLIAGWLGKKAIKVKYGIPVMVRRDAKWEDPECQERRR